MTTANAWAENLPTSTMNVSVTFQKLHNITVAQPLSAGVVTIDPKAVNDASDGFMDIISFGTGIVSSTFPAVAVKENTLGIFVTDERTFENPFYVQGTGTRQMCIADASSICRFSEPVALYQGIQLRNLRFEYSPSEEQWTVDGILQADKVFLQEGYSDAYDTPFNFPMTVSYLYE